MPKEAQVYVDAKTYVYLEIELQRPLIPRRPASVLAQRLVILHKFDIICMFVYVHECMCVYRDSRYSLHPLSCYAS